MGFAGVLVLKTLVTGVAPWEGEPWVPQALPGPPVLQSQAERSSLCSGPTPCLWKRENTARLGEEPCLSLPYHLGTRVLESTSEGASGLGVQFRW